MRTLAALKSASLICIITYIKLITSYYSLHLVFSPSISLSNVIDDYPI